MLKGVTREFYVCTTAGRRDWRTALCVFDSEARAGEYLRPLGGPRKFVETMQCYGMRVPDWMLHKPQLPGAHETTAPELCRVAEGIGVEWVAVNPPPVEPYPGEKEGNVEGDAEGDALALLTMEDLRERPYAPYRANLSDTTVEIGRGERN